MCDCGCNKCDITQPPIMLNESLAPKQILSEGLKHHLDTKTPLTEHLYRAGSTNYFNLWAEARTLYSREILEITHEDDLAVLTETDLGHFGVIYEIEVGDQVKASKEYGGLSGEVVDVKGSFIVVKTKEGNQSYHESDLKVLNKEGKKVPLDFPMLDEEVNSGDLNNAVYRLKNVYKYLDIEYKETRRGEKYVQINYIPVTSPQSQNPEFVNVRYNNDEDLEIIKNRLDFPIELNEQMDIYDDIANEEFGMDYDQLGSNEKEWVRDEIDNMSMNEAKKDIYDKFLDNPQNPKGRAKTIISKFLKQYGENATEMAVDRFAKQNDLKPEEKYILKYITKQDIKISSQPGGPDFSALEESKYKKGDKLKVKLKNGKEFDITFDSYSSNKGIAYGKIDGDRKPFSLDAVVNESKKKAKKNTKKLNKPMRDSSGGKAYKVYVKDPKTKKIKTVRFGSGGLRAKINDKEARNAFAARHKCSTKKDKTKAGYWSCRLPRYAKLLGLKSNFGGFW